MGKRAREKWTGRTEVARVTDAQRRAKKVLDDKTRTLMAALRKAALPDDVRPTEAPPP